MPDSQSSGPVSSTDQRPVSHPTFPEHAEPVELGDGPFRLTTDASSEPPDETRPVGRLSQRRKVVLGSVLAVAVVGGAVVGGFGWRMAQHQDTTLSTPVQVAGLTRDDGEQAAETAEYLRNGIGADIDLDRSVGAVYADPADPGRSVLLFGGTTLIWQPERDLDRLFELVSGDEEPVSAQRGVSPGNFGGVMKCGTTSTLDGELSVCGWADHGSVALGMFPGRGVDESAKLFREIRAAVQTRD